MTTVDKLVSLLNQEGQTHISFNTEDTQKDEFNTVYSVVGIIYCDAGLKCLFCLPKRLFPIIVSFSYIYTSQGSVETQLRRGGIFNNHVIANFLQSVSVKEFLKPINIWRRYGQKYGGRFFLWLTVYNTSERQQCQEAVTSRSEADCRENSVNQLHPVTNLLAMLPSACLSIHFVPL